MNCGVCRQRAMVGVCVECRLPLCESCGGSCDGCGARICPAHWPKGRARALCSGCRGVKQAPAPPVAAPRVPVPPPKAEPVASTSFQDLMADVEGPAVPPRPTPQTPVRPLPAVPPAAAAPKAESTGFHDLIAEMGDLPMTTPPPEPEPELEAGPERFAPAPPQRGGAPAAARTLPKAELYDRTPHRVLTGSSKKATPAWVSAALAGALACVLGYLFLRGAPKGAISSYAVLVMGGGSVLWGLAGMFETDAAPSERKLCLIGVCLGAMAAAWAASIAFG